jgi:hypothetical protein
MSTNTSNSRPAAITALALAICALGLGQIFCAGLMPSVNVIGILSGGILITTGVVVWAVKGLWRKESANAYLNFLTGALFLLIAINGALGLGIAQYRVAPIFVWAFVVTGLVFFFLGWFLLRTQSRK